MPQQDSFHTPDDRDLDRYLAGEATAAERSAIDAWLSSHRHRRALFGVLSGRSTPQTHRDLAALDRRIQLEIAASETERGSRRSGHRAQQSKTHVISLVLRRSMFGVIAAVLIAVGLFTVHERRTPNVTQRFHTSFGQRSVIPLAGGSTMLLGPGTFATVSPSGIDVTGEAYFTVVSHPAHPFIVRTRSAVVNVLGTRFSVRQYPNDTNSRVLVEDGRVSLHTRRSSRPNEARVILSARMLALVTDSGVTVTSGVATRDYTGWTQGTLVFEGMPLRDVAAELSRAYGFDIRITDTTLAKQMIHMDVTIAEDSVAQILDGICGVADAHYTRDGRTILLSPGRSSAPPQKLAPPRRLSPQPEHQYGR